MLIVLACIKPSEAEVIGKASPQMQKLIEKDEQSTRKYVTITYNNMGIINFCSFSSSGANELTEKYVGFAGKVYSADSGKAKVVGQMVNYTYRMLGCGENVMHGAKLTILLTTLSIIIGVILGVFLLLEKFQKRRYLTNCAVHTFSSSEEHRFLSSCLLYISQFREYLVLPGEICFQQRIQKLYIREHLLQHL